MNSLTRVDSTQSSLYMLLIFIHKLYELLFNKEIGQAQKAAK